MIGVGDPVRLAPEVGDECPLLETKDGLGRSGEREVALDRLPALRIGGGATLTVDDPQLDAG